MYNSSESDTKRTLEDMVRAKNWSHEPYQRDSVSYRHCSVCAEDLPMDEDCIKPCWKKIAIAIGEVKI